MFISQSRIACSLYRMSVALLCDGAYEEIDDDGIAECSIVNNYNDNFFPLLHMRLNFTHAESFNIREYSDQLMVRVRVFEGKVPLTDIQRYGGATAAGLNIDTVIDEYFQTVNLDMNYYQQYTDEGNPNTRLGNTRHTEATNRVNTEELELYLFSVNGLNSNKKIINAILSNLTIENALVYMFNTTGIKKAIMSKPQNQKFYGTKPPEGAKMSEIDKSQIILPPMNLKNSIDNLQKMYGIYNIGLISFLDFDRFYLIDKDYRNPLPLGKNEYEDVYVYIRDIDDNVTSKDGSYTDNANRCYMVSCFDNGYINDDSDMLKEGSGNQYQIMTEKTAIDSVSYDEDLGKFNFVQPYNRYGISDNSNKNANDKTIMLYSNVENDFSEQSMINNRMENTTTITLNFVSVDISIFKINRKYHIEYENRDKSIYDGSYRLNNLGYGMNQREFYVIAEFKRLVV